MLLPSIIKEIENDQVEAPSVDGTSDKNDKLLNSINFIPKHIEVKESKLWKNKDMSKIEDLTTIEPTFDWSFCSPYKGSVKALSS